ncbi:Por secretion system C-terminal sorting domain-containing protein [Fibrobacter sp. UWT2]|uniref:T9SS type A sorting domain-containing protein n=1 Tax=Fibrobacter sp. UWT2 TaxID=1896224 RepID=UPI0009179B80|nr:T9SS type A sorting domain-containing protein [Fibrobacter sp. UWT2]SHK98727.1 Por secretion system C-terminal sorting domain-containing protein [Fibrobacter sp. UWT2]
MKTAIFSSILTVGLGASAWAATPVEIPMGGTLVIDNFANADANSALGPWDIYPDASGKTTLDTSFVSNAGVNGTSNALRLDYSLDGSNVLGYDPFVEAAVYVDKNSAAADFSNCNEIQYEYRGNYGHSFRVIGDVDVASDYHHTMLDGEYTWQTATIHWNDLYQAGWGIDGDIDYVKKNLLAFSWQVQNEDGTEGYLEIANIRCKHAAAYTVSFYWGDSLLRSEEFFEGDWPNYNGSYSFSTEKYEYEINGWTPERDVVTADASYHAVLDSSIRHYEVRFMNQFGDELMSQELEYGMIPAYVGLNPEKIPSVGYSYTFKGWGKRVCEEVEHEYCYDYGKGEYCDSWTENECKIVYEESLAPVTENAWYYPAYDSTLNSYTVKFADYNGDSISEKMYTYGTKGIEIPAAPTRAAAGDTTYTFKGWMPYIDEDTEVDGNAVYVATYTATVTNGEDTVDVELYTVTFVNGSEILQTGEYAWGETPEYTGVIPSKDSTAEYVYTFSDWRDPEGWYGTHETYGNTIYMALFDEQYRKYWIVFRNDDDTVIDSIQFDYGSTIGMYDLMYYYNLKVKSIEDGYSQDYYSGAWTPELKRVTGRAEYKAIYSYRVRFADVDGRVIKDQWLKKGEIPDCKDCNTKKDPTAEYTYEFVGWNKEYAPVTDTTTYIAVYRAVPVPKPTVQEIAVGESLLIDDFEDGDEISTLGTGWFVYNDNDAIYDINGNDTLYYNSQISKMVTIAGDKGNVMNLLYKGDCEIDDDKGRLYCRGWLGAGLMLAPEDQSLDLSQCNAIQYDYRGGAHNFRIQSLYDKNDQYLETHVVGSDTFTTATILRSSFGYDYWFMGSSVSADLAFTHATAFVWNNMQGEGTLEIDNIRCLHKPSYIVKFYDGETLLDSAEFVEGEMPEYNGETDLWWLAYNREDPQYSYSFDGWTPELAPVQADVSYQVAFEKSPKTYDICFYGDKGYGFDGYCQEVEYGQVPVFEGELTIDPDESCNEYEFTKWRSCEYKLVADGGYQYVCVNELVPVTGRRTYYAEFDCKDPRTFTITFLNDNGDTLSSKEYGYDEYVDEPYAEKEATEQYVYSFTGWSPDVERWVYEDATYTAQYEAYPREYNVRFVNSWGSSVYVNDEYEIAYPYGTPYSDIALPTEVLDDDQYWDTIFVFAGWDIDQTGDGIVKSDMVIKPKYNKKYAVRFESYDWNGTFTIPVGDSEVVYYPEGMSLSQIVKPADPTRKPWHDYETDSIVKYEFAGWLPTFGEDDVLTGPMTFRANYKTSDNKYTVTFMADDEVIYQIEVAKDSVPKYDGWIPYRSSTSEFSYVWDSEDGWEPALSAVTGPVVYHAKFKAVPQQYEVVFVTEAGDTISRKTYGYGATITDAPAMATIVAGKTGEFEYSEDWCTLGTGWRWYDNDGDEIWEEYHYINCGNPGLEPVTENVTYVPNIRYQVGFYDGDGKLMNDEFWSDFGWYRYGEEPEYYCEKGYCYGYQIPTKTSSVAYDYVWNGGWTPALDTVRGSTGYTATFDSTLRQYEVVFEDEDGTVLKAAILYNYGTLVNDIMLPPDPKKNPTATTVYTFKGWSLKPVTGDVTYKASYEESPRMYLVTFVGDDGKTIVDTASYEYETDVSKIVVPEAPVKDGFKFTGWTPEIASVTSEATYKANYVESNKFVVTWRNEDGTMLLQQTYTEGETPTYAGETPTKESTVESDFAFDGWTPAVAAVAKDVEYTATYKASARKYYVKFVNYEGTLLDSTVYEYGTLAEAITVPAVPERASTENYIYTFAGWLPAVGDVTGDVTYMALFGNEKRTYTVTFVDENGEVLNSDRYYYNEVVNKPTWGPRKTTPECYYEFESWKLTAGSSDTVKSDMEYTVVYSTQCEERRYYVDFYDPIAEDWYGEKAYAYGTKASELTNIPNVVEDTTIGDCSYHFVGWEPEITDVTTHMDYSAKYEKTCKTQFEVAWRNDDGTTLKTEKYNKNEIPNYDGETPVKKDSERFTYRFRGWTPEITAVVADTYYTAKYDSAYRMYDIYFVDRFNHDGFVNGEWVASYRYGTAASVVASDVPALAAVVNGNCTYTFKKWDNPIEDVTAIATYVAEYDTVCIDPPASSSSEVPPVSSSSEPSVVSSSSEVPVVSSSSEEPVVSSSSEPPVVSSSSVVPPASSSSVVPPVSSSSEPPVVSSSSEVPAVSSSSEPPVVSSSSEVPPVSSSSEPPVVSSSSEEPVVSSSSEPPVVSSSSVVPPASSSSVVPPVSSSSEPPVVSSSSEVPAVSSSSEPPKSSSSSVTPESSSSDNPTYVANNLQSTVKFGLANRTLTIMLTSPSAVRVQVFDMNGQLLEGFNEFVTGSKDFDLSALKQGNYVVRVTGDNVKKSTRISIR